MSSNSGMDLLTLMGIISQMESQVHTIPETKLNDPKYVVNTRIYEHGNGNGNTRVNKNIGTTHRRYHTLMGNAKTNKRI